MIAKLLGLLTKLAELGEAVEQGSDDQNRLVAETSAHLQEVLGLGGGLTLCDSMDVLLGTYKAVSIEEPANESEQKES